MSYVLNLQKLDPGADATSDQNPFSTCSDICASATSILFCGGISAHVC
jgi:hypothetical protein